LRPNKGNCNQRCNYDRMKDFIKQTYHFLNIPFCINLPSSLTFTMYTPLGKMP
jgi:hypothetical protein